MIWAVLDTNTVVSGFGWPHGPPGRIIDHALRGHFLPVVSPPLLDELGRVLQYEKLVPYFPDPLGIVLLWETTCGLAHPTARVSVCRDDTDNRVLEAATTAHSDYIVSGDADLLDLREFEGVEIVSPKDFLHVIEVGE